MADIPGYGHWMIPSADSPYPVVIGDSEGCIKTDNCGQDFEVIGNKYHAATALLDHVWDAMKQISRPHDHPLRQYREGVFNFIFENRKIVDVKPYFDFTEPYIDFSPEKRPEVLEMIGLVKRIIPLMVFL